MLLCRRMAVQDNRIALSVDPHLPPANSQASFAQVAPIVNWVLLRVSPRTPPHCVRMSLESVYIGVKSGFDRDRAFAAPRRANRICGRA